ncbi:MAG TPA: hypothetical protein VHC50_05360 [Puia sp.]|jgi:hypothetical protein|nr:hypothetical protein [Puia sp.]
MLTNKKWVIEFALLFITLVSITGIREFNFMNEDRARENEFNVLNLIATPGIAIKNKVRVQSDPDKCSAEDSVSNNRKVYGSSGSGRQAAWN